MFVFNSSDTVDLNDRTLTLTEVEMENEKTRILLLYVRKYGVKIELKRNLNFSEYAFMHLSS